jgi:hypothetical protein
MGQPNGLLGHYRIKDAEGTGGIETSQYPEEQKSFP